MKYPLKIFLKKYLKKKKGSQVTLKRIKARLSLDYLLITGLYVRCSIRVPAFQLSTAVSLQEKQTEKGRIRNYLQTTFVFNAINVSFYNTCLIYMFYKRTLHIFHIFYWNHPKRELKNNNKKIQKGCKISKTCSY